MPRKRTTRAQMTHTLPKLKGLADIDDITEMTNAQKKAKLDSLIADFKYNVENIKKQYGEILVAGENEIDKRFHVIRCQLSPDEMKMTVKEYFDYTMSEGEEKENVVAMPTRPVKPSLDSKSNIAQTVMKYKSIKMIETIPEEGVSSSEETGTVKRGTRKRRCTAKGKGVTFNREPQPTPCSGFPMQTNSLAQSFVTPAMQRTMSEMGWGATPLVTPKFDPRLPQTPANARRLKPGEVGLSLAGSPLMEADNKKNTILIHGEELEIPETTDIQTLMSKLKSMIGGQS
ncbi:Cell division cycle associated 8 [Mactra antiquata]